MERISINFTNSLIDEYKLNEVLKNLELEINNMNQARNKKYEDDRASINLLDDSENISNIKNLTKEKKKLNPEYIVVIGIGGSNLGTIAVQEAILGKLYNQLEPKIKVLYVDTVDEDLISDIIKIVEPCLESGNNIIINGVSKSGGTLETISNFEIFIDLIKKYKKDYEKYVVITTDKNSNFWKYAIQNNFSVLEIPKKVGGRFSVFSAVGLFPLGLLGINIDDLLIGARYMRDQCICKNAEENPAAISASLIYIYREKNYNIHDLFLFSKDLESIGKWYRQLMGESIGKEFDISQKQVFVGVTPTYSIGSIDLHSMAQLYLGGPYDKFTTFVFIKKNRNKVFVPDHKEFSNLVDNIQNIQLHNIMYAIYEGVKIAYEKSKRPFIEINLPDKSEKSIGQFLQLKMIEMMYIGYLLNVNPFNQPNVESYKIETKKILDKTQKLA